MYVNNFFWALLLVDGILRSYRDWVVRYSDHRQFGAYISNASLLIISWCKFAHLMFLRGHWTSAILARSPTLARIFCWLLNYNNSINTRVCTLDDALLNIILLMHTFRNYHKIKRQQKRTNVFCLSIIRKAFTIQKNNRWFWIVFY